MWEVCRDARLLQKAEWDRHSLDDGKEFVEELKDLSVFSVLLTFQREIREFKTTH